MLNSNIHKHTNFFTFSSKTVLWALTKVEKYFSEQLIFIRNLKNVLLSAQSLDGSWRNNNTHTSSSSSSSLCTGNVEPTAYAMMALEALYGRLKAAKVLRADGMHMRLCLCVHAYALVLVCACACACACVCLCLCTCMRMCMLVCLYSYACACVCAHARVCIRARVHMCALALALVLVCLCDCARSYVCARACTQHHDPDTYYAVYVDG